MAGVGYSVDGGMSRKWASKIGRNDPGITNETKEWARDIKTKAEAMATASTTSHYKYHYGLRQVGPRGSGWNVTWVIHAESRIARAHHEFLQQAADSVGLRKKGEK